MSKIQIYVATCIVIFLSTWTMLYADSIKKIEFINVPPCGAGANSRGDIAGQIYNLEDSDKYKVVLYAHTDRWYVQPLISHPFTNIDNSGKWSNWTHLGNRYAALVVKLAFKPPSKSLSLPVGDDVILTAETPSSTECHR